MQFLISVCGGSFEAECILKAQKEQKTPGGDCGCLTCSVVVWCYLSLENFDFQLCMVSALETQFHKVDGQNLCKICDFIKPGNARPKVI